MKSITYKKYIEYSFLRYALSIIVILFIMMIAFLSVNFKVIENLENKKNTQKLLQVLEILNWRICPQMKILLGFYQMVTTVN